MIQLIKAVKYFNWAVQLFVASFVEKFMFEEFSNFSNVARGFFILLTRNIEILTCVPPKKCF